LTQACPRGPREICYSLTAAGEAIDPAQALERFARDVIARSR
jgi:hypothetical protein